MKSVLHGGEGECVAAPPTFSHFDGEGIERPEGMFQEPCGSSVLPSVALGPRGWQQPHFLDLLVTGYSSKLEGQSTKTAQQNQAGGGGNKLKNKWLFLVEFGVLIGEAEASGGAGERAR